MTQNGSNVDFIDDIYFALFACMFRMTADYYSVYQFVAHLAGKFRRFEILLDVSYKVIGTLYRIRCFSQSLFKFRDFVFQSFLLVGIHLYEADTDIFRHFAFQSVLISKLHKAG